jgi:hypothetical protein
MVLIRPSYGVSGWRFDVKEFHWQILSLGGVPLNLLEESIHQWIGEHVAHSVSGRATVLHPSLLHYILLLLLLFSPHRICGHS